MKKAHKNDPYLTILAMSLGSMLFTKEIMPEGIYYSMMEANNNDHAESLYITEAAIAISNKMVLENKT